MPFPSPCPCARREPPGHGVSPALPLHVHHPAVEPILHTPDHPLPPPPWAGLAEGVRAVCVLGWFRPGHRTGESRGAPEPCCSLISAPLSVCLRAYKEGAHLGLEQQGASHTTRLDFSGSGVESLSITAGPIHHGLERWRASRSGPILLGLLALPVGLISSAEVNL